MISRGIKISITEGIVAMVHMDRIEAIIKADALYTKY